MLRVGNVVDLYYYASRDTLKKVRATVDEWDIAGVSLLVTTDRVQEEFFPWTTVQRMVKV